jgi:hypothetical protein
MDHCVLIEKLGGATAVARDLGMPFQRVRFWHKRQNIPVEYWRDVIRLASERRVRVSEKALAEGVRPPSRRVREHKESAA